MTKHPLTEYVNRLAALMGLSNWHITIRSGAPDTADAWAETKVWERALRGDIVLNVDKRPDDRPHLREILVHELLHLHLADLDHAAQGVETVLGQSVYTVFYDRHSVDEEKTVQQIARFWAPKLPLPPPVKE